MPNITSAIKSKSSSYPQNKFLDFAFNEQKIGTVNALLTTKLMTVLCIIAMLTHLILAMYYFATPEYSSQEMRYDNLEDCQIDFENPQYGKICTFEMVLKTDMEIPAKVYYQISGFYQNHYTYKSSISYDQQYAKFKSSYSDCFPLERFESKIIYPCGLVSGSVFSDQIVATVRTPTGSTDLVPNNDSTGYPNELQSWKKEGIAWEIDIKSKSNFDVTSDMFNSTFYRYGPEQNRQSILLPLVTDEDHLVWIRISPWSTFRKIYRKIEVLKENGSNIRKIPKGSVVAFTIKNYFRVDGKSQRKYVVLSSGIGSGDGSKNKIMIINLTLGGVCFLCLISIFFNFVFCPRKFADINYLE